MQDAKPVSPPPPPPSPERQPEPEPAAKPQAVREEPAVSVAQDDLPPWTDDDAPPPPDDGDAPPWDDEPVPAAPPSAREPVVPTMEPVVPASVPEPEVKDTAPIQAAQAAPSAPAGFDWARYVQLVTPKLGVGYQVLFRSAGDASGELDGDTLVIRLSAGILYNGLSTPNNLEILRATACELAGREIHVRVLPMGDAAQRSLDELRAFREVRFIRKDGN